MPKYDFACPECEARFELDRSMGEANALAACPVCASASTRVYTMPKLLFKADPRDVTPVWHNHAGYSHAHAPRRGRHKLPSEDH